MVRSDFGRRLDEAIKLPGRPGSIRKFQELLEQRFKKSGRHAYSYPSVNSYLRGTAAPNVEWVEAVAELLAVRPAKLAFGQGPWEETGEDFAGQIDEVLRGAFPEFDNVASAEQEMVRNSVVQIAGLQPDRGSWETYRSAAQRLGRILGSALREIELDGPRVPRWELSGYVAGVCQALRLLLTSLHDPTLVGTWKKEGDD